MRPRSPWTASAGWTTCEGTPTLAIVAGDAVVAWLAADAAEDRPRRELLGLWAAPGEHGGRLLGALLQDFVARDSRPVRLAGVHAAELDGGWLEAHGFAAGAATIGYATEAQPG